jgi:threonine aldolase
MLLTTARRGAGKLPLLARGAAGRPRLARALSTTDGEGEGSAASSSSSSGRTRVGEFRSDTFTKPTPSMYIAMLDAEVGDDVYGEDPSVRGLERTAAGLLDKEAALFVPSATMANLVSVGAWCRRGDGLILGDESHIFYYEQGGASWLMGAVLHTLPNQADGTLRLTGKGSVRDAIEARAASKTDPHYASHGLVAIENTHNRCGGAVLPPAYVDDLGALCKENRLPLHVDGSRLFNAAAALGVPASRLVRGADSVTVCLSKGVGAPVGAVVVGSAEMVERARRLRKAVGGGMRQAGLLAAAGIVGLKEIVPKLASDHARAKSLARGLAAVPGVQIDVSRVQTNIMYFDLDAASLDVAHLRAKCAAAAAAGKAPLTVRIAGTELTVRVEDVVTPSMTTSGAFAALIATTHACKIGAYGDRRLRAVTHHQVSDGDVDRLIEGAQAASELLRK